MEKREKNEFLERIREREKLERKHRRKEIFNLSRTSLGVSDIYSIGPNHIQDICKKIKSKNKAEEHDFKILRQGLILHQKNIDAFFTVDGALQGLIRELTGRRVDRQLESANCLCNLSLGTSKQTFLVAKASSAYLTTHLDSLNWPLVDICTWTLGNLSASDIKVWHLIHEQGFLNKIIQLLDHTCHDVLISTIYALNHFLNLGIDNISDEDLSQLASKICGLFHNKYDVSLTLFLLSSKQILDSLFISKLIISTIIQHISLPSTSLKSITLYIRCLANWSCENSGCAALQIIEESKKLDLFWPNLLLRCSHGHLVKEFMWFLGNLSSHNNLEISNFVKYEILQKNISTFHTFIQDNNL